VVGDLHERVEPAAERRRVLGAYVFGKAERDEVVEERDDADALGSRRTE
jgi:hypothetical protein